MPAEIQTTEVLDAVRTCLGYGVTVDATDYTWQWMLEGPALRWIDEISGYPLITLEPDDSELTYSPGLIKVELPLTINVVISVAAIHSGDAPTPRVYQLVREVGEAALLQLAVAGHKLGTEWIDDRVVNRPGVDRRVTEIVYDRGLGVYKWNLTAIYFVSEVHA